MIKFRLIASFALALLASSAVAQEGWDRPTFWDLELGSTLDQMPPWEAFRAYACGSDGGPPARRLAGWADYGQCPADGNGLHEVYFEYDDELEFIARAREMVGELSRWAGTMERGYPVMVSALFDDAGILRGLRMVTDPRPEYQPDNFWVEATAREQHYLLGSQVAPRLDVVPSRDCVSAPPAAGETPVGTLFIKMSCERIDEAAGRRIVMKINLFRKPGQSGRNPFLPTELTEGQFESTARIELYDLD